MGSNDNEKANDKTAGVPSTISDRSVGSDTYGLLRKQLFPWQLQCLNIWFRNQGRGIVNVVTGAGKTVLALGAIARLEYTLSRIPSTDLKIKIIVPKVFLAQQWAQVLQEDLAVSREDIGIYSGAHKDSPDRKYMIYVVNSARYTLARHLLADYRHGSTILLIADECHHYGSPENSHIFDFTKKFAAPATAVAAATAADTGAFAAAVTTAAAGATTDAATDTAAVTEAAATAVTPTTVTTTAATVPPDVVTPSRYYALGLSATPETAAFREKLVPALGPEIYKYGFTDALNDNIISPFSIFNLKLQFTRYEQEQYQDLSDQLTRALENLKHLCPFLNSLSGQQFFAALEELAQAAADPDAASLARAVMILAVTRKDVVYRAKSRLSCVENLLDRIPRTSKILIFNERIEVAEAIYERLQRLFPGQVGRYHSEMDEGSRKRILRKYQDSEIRILVSCRALDEGLNVPETDVGIIASSTSSSRQRIQRLGRVLRRSGKAHTAYLYYLYIGSSNEEPELLTDLDQELVGMIPVLDLDYEQETQSFIYPAYQALAERVLAHGRRQRWDSRIISEIERNLEQGKLGCDWWNSENTCGLRAQTASSRAERNYWITMRLLVRASLNRL